MATHNAHPASTDRQDAPTASLTVELRSDERTRLGVFRETFLKWVSDRSAGTLALGAPDSLTLEEVQPGPDGTPMLRMDMSWHAQRPSSGLVLSTPAQVVELPALVGADGPVAPTRMSLADDFQFFPDPSQLAAPIYRELPPSVHPDTLAPIPTRNDGLPMPLPLQTVATQRLHRLIELTRTQLHALQPALRSINVRVSVVRVNDAHLRHAAAAVATVVLMLGGAAYLAMPSRVAKAPVQTLAVAEASAPAADSTIDVVDEPAPVPVVDHGSAPPPPSVSATAPKTPVGTSGGARAVKPAAQAPAAVKATRAAGAPAVVRGIENVASSAAARSGVKGALLVTSDPIGAEVSINGIPHGRTPLTIRGLNAGSRVVRLELAGYERWSWAVSVVANRQTPVTVKLHPELRKTSSPD